MSLLFLVLYILGYIAAFYATYLSNKHRIYNEYFTLNSAIVVSLLSWLFVAATLMCYLATQFVDLLDSTKTSKIAKSWDTLCKPSPKDSK